jgi:hypothetical protein
LRPKPNTNSALGWRIIRYCKVAHEECGAGWKGSRVGAVTTALSVRATGLCSDSGWWSQLLGSFLSLYIPVFGRILLALFLCWPISSILVCSDPFLRDALSKRSQVFRAVLLRLVFCCAWTGLLDDVPRRSREGRGGPLKKDNGLRCLLLVMSIDHRH